jgi:hypothetical protein
MAFRIKLYQQLFVFALSAKEDLIPVGIFSPGKIEAVRTLQYFSDIQGIRPGGNHLKANDSVRRIKYELGALTKVWSIGRGQQQAIGGSGDSSRS